MKYPLKTQTQYDKFRSAVYRVIKHPYVAMALFAYVLIGMAVALYLSKAPTYQSELDLVLPGTGASASVAIDDVGQVVSQTSAPFGAGGFNPRVNYKEMLISRSVIGIAAESLGLSVAKFGKPKIKLTEQTSILDISITGTSPEQAQKKAQALYDSLQQELGRLRADEVRRRDTSIQTVLDEYRVRLNDARSAILDFQQGSFLVSQEQFGQTISVLQNLQEKQVYLEAKSTNIADYVKGLSENLGVSADLAGKAFILQSDVEFRGLLKELDVSTSTLSEYQSRWGAGHPKVIAEAERFSAAKKALISKSNLIVGPHASNAFNSFDLEFNPKRAQMFADLIDASANLKGARAELMQLQNSQALLKDQLKILARESAVLDRLQREFDLAQAVFTSAAARLEAGKADVFASYPVVQILTPPLLPSEVHSPIPALGIAAALFAIIFITSGVIVLCNRRRIIDALLKKN